jgi:hypothetical protein
VTLRFLLFPIDAVPLAPKMQWPRLWCRPCHPAIVIPGLDGVDGPDLYGIAMCQCGHG